MEIEYKGKLTKHFSSEEYTVNQTEKCSINNEAIEHANLLEEMRVYWGKPIRVNSWYRTASYNKKCGGVSTSNHLRGTATDVMITFATDEEFLKFAKKWKAICKSHGTVGEIGRYKTFTHLGSHIKYSQVFYNWDKRSGKQINMYYKI